MGLKILYYLIIFLELPAGCLSEFLVGFSNKGSNVLVLETLEASLRYPTDFNFYIQNFSTMLLEKTVTPGLQATLHYSFIPSDAFVGRRFGLSINLAYREYVSWLILTIQNKIRYVKELSIFIGWKTNNY